MDLPAQTWLSFTEYEKPTVPSTAVISLPPTILVLKKCTGTNRATRWLDFFSLTIPSPANVTTKCPPHACCFSSFRWMDSKLTRWQLATTDIFILFGKKKSKLFFSTTVKPKKWCYVMFISIHSSGPVANVAFKGGGVAHRLCFWVLNSCGHLTPITLNGSLWLLSTKWNEKLVVTLLVWWVLTANTDNFSPSGFWSWIT